MKKLRLNLDEIRVVSFAAETAERDRGTVNANSDTAVTPILACGVTQMESCRSCFPDVCPNEKITTEYWQNCPGV